MLFSVVLLLRLFTFLIELIFFLSVVVWVVLMVLFGFCYLESFFLRQVFLRFSMLAFGSWLPIFVHFFCFLFV